MTVTATSGGKSGAAIVTVVRTLPSNSLTITPAKVTLVAGTSIVLRATLTDASGHVLDRPLLWSGSDDVIEVTPLGPQTARVTALVAGETTVTANQNGVEPVGTASITVVGTGAVASVRIAPAVTPVFLGAKAQLTATLRDAQGAVLTGLPIVWASKNSAISVTQTGLVTGLAGTGFLDDSRITATSEGVQGIADVVVVSSTARIVVTPGGATVAAGATVQLTAEVSDGGTTVPGGDYAWASSDTAVATVSQSGLVKGRSAGNVLIKASLQGNSSSAAVGVRAMTARPLQAVSVGYGHACGLMSGGEAYCWGENSSGQLGSNSSTQSIERIPVQVTGGLSFSQMSAGSRFTCGLVTAGAGYCWGANDVGQVGVPEPGTYATPVRVTNALPFVAITSGGSHACGLAAAGEAYCWGDNEARELGVASTASTCREGEFLAGQCSSTPVRVVGGLSFIAIAAGGYHTCGIALGGALYCWGAGSALGVTSAVSTCLDGYLDPYPCSATPLLVSRSLRFTAVTAGALHTCALTSDGTAYCWGAAASDGSLGNGATSGSQTPVAVAGGLRFAAIAAGGAQTCAITPAGSAYCWGRGPLLGNGVDFDRSVPTVVTSSVAFGRIAAGQGGSCAIATESGAAYCWGLNSFGELGDGTTTLRLVPTPVGFSVAP